MPDDTRDEREAWQRGPVDGVPALLQPVAHALIQAGEDARRAAASLGTDALWARPAGVASAGFHLRHIAGVTDRLFTYARAEPLDTAQLAYLAAEGDPGDPMVDAATLLRALDAAIDRALAQLRVTDPATLTDPRTIGRARLPTTVTGLLTHAAEHASRHVGQLVVTGKVVGSSE